MMEGGFSFSGPAVIDAQSPQPPTLSVLAFSGFIRDNLAQKQKHRG